MNRPTARILLVAVILTFATSIFAQDRFEPLDVFDLEYVSDPRISPDGQQIVYVRNFKDIMTDRNLSNLWIVNFDGSGHRPLTTGKQRDHSPRLSPEGDKLLYSSNRDGDTQLYLRWLDTGAEARITNLTRSPGDVQWSPTGDAIAFTMSVLQEDQDLVKRPKAPRGAEWTSPPIYIDEITYRADGAGYLDDAHTHIFTMPLQGGHPRQITKGDFDHESGFDWSPDGASIIFSANRHPEGAYDPRNTEIFRQEIASGEVVALTDRQGPDNGPLVSPNGRLIAYTGFDDRYQGYQITELHIMNSDGSGKRMLSGDFDRDIGNIQWDAASNGLYFQYDDQGKIKIAHIDLQGRVSDLTDEVGGLSLGRPYSAGTFSVATNGNFAFTHSAPDHPADLAVGDREGSRRLTHVNQDLFGYKTLGEVEEIWYESSFDGRRIQGWICKPPGFDPTVDYPLILEIHGGPFAAYGPHFSAEVQLYAAAGYVVLYTNPRGSTSYGEEFGNLIHHAYPSNDYEDLMSGVDALVERGYIDEDQLYVTGGSGGGVLTAWIVGKTDRFQAAVVAKPVINWGSFVLHADNPTFFAKYWFPGMPWEYPEHYWNRSPLSLVGNVKTPTMLLTGEQDYRTPMSETEQYYAALKLNKVETAMVRIQESSHGIAARTSNLISKVQYILGWFEKHGKP
ncbi:MAG: S9 family peptidase [Saprospiraceae bacterium]|nr:S9 family peptidase [Saprospiraceae bacterium]